MVCYRCALVFFLYMVISCLIFFSTQTLMSRSLSALRIKMLLRLVRRSFVAVRPLSTEAATAVKSTSLGGGTSSSTSLEGDTSISTSLKGGSSTTISTGGRDTLGKRLLSLIYAKRSAVIAIRKWKEEGHPVRKYELNRIVQELRRHKRYKHALEVLILHINFFTIYF